MREETSKLPSFIIIGAMKSATTTIYEQLKLLDGVFMPDLKEPNFFSDEEQFSKGEEWYRELFSSAQKGDIIGEASTHYTKLPTYPDAASRLHAALPNAKIIYIMRHPVDRLVSQYIHEWTCRKINVDINVAIEKHPELISYSCYAKQLAPYLTLYGAENILPVFFERIKEQPESELERIAQFIGYRGTVTWQTDVTRTNVSSQRIRTNSVTKFLIQNPFFSFLRRALVPQKLRTALKTRMQMQGRPSLTESSLSKLDTVFNADLQLLSKQLSCRITLNNFKTEACAEAHHWLDEKTLKTTRGDHVYQ
ncbi:sulfotransferase family protein [Microbulbifer agarilyticus]